jgi:hypothetical protein
MGARARRRSGDSGGPGQSPVVRVVGAFVGLLSLPEAWVVSDYRLAVGFGSIWARRTDQVIRIRP